MDTKNEFQERDMDFCNLGIEISERVEKNSNSPTESETTVTPCFFCC